MADHSTPLDTSQDSTQTDAKSSRRRALTVALAALGIVYGDIGTSPLYAIRECFHGEYGIEPSHDNVMGVLSLIFWALMIVVSIKYLIFILRADNRGEGGVLALTALVSHAKNLGRLARWILPGMGLFAASLLYGDGIITPAISVLSAVEGIRIITPVFEPYVIPLTVAILIALFLLQHRGTGKVGALFGPITFVWFCVIAILGLVSVVRHPGVLLAVKPLYGADFLIRNHLHGFLVLGAVFLVVTGAEALYADLGHFSRSPIRRAWFAVVLPSLLLNYFGQGAVLLFRPEEAHHPFYALVPSILLIPMVILATAATIIASQAVISGAFSLTRQAIQLGYLPRLRVIHTSAREIGQVYMPQVNNMLMLGTLVLVLGFQSSSKLAAAYGVAVTTTMLITTMLFYFVARRLWNWNRLAAGSLTLVFAIADLSFFSANMSKITHGAWFPLAIGAVTYAMMSTWKKGRSLLARKLYSNAPTFDDLLERLEEGSVSRVPGKAVFLAATPNTIPPALLHNIKHNRVLHQQNAILTILTEEVPRIPNDEKITITKLNESFSRIVARYGFMEEPNMPNIIALAHEQGLDFKLQEITFFLGRERLLQARASKMMNWRERLFALMTRNAQGPTDYFSIPPNQVVELGAQITV